MPVIRHRAWSALVAVAVCGLLTTSRLLAQAQADFQPITGDNAALERLPATPFVFAAYSIVWLVLIAYVFSIWRRLGRVQQELTALTARLDQPRR